jgi:hypothetical protein
MFTMFTSLRFDSAVPFRFGVNRIRGSWVLAKVAVVAKALIAGPTFLIDTVVVGHFVNPLSRDQIRHENEPHIRTLPISEPKKRQGSSDFMGI